MTNLPVGATPDRALAKHVLGTPVFDVNDALSQFGGEQLQSTRMALFERLTPLKQVEPKLDGSLAGQVRDYLKVIGGKVRPEFSTDQCMVWLNAVLMALSDLPAFCLRAAALDAIHVPFTFPNEVEAKVRQLAEAERERYQRAMRRIDAMQREIQRAATMDTLQIEADPAPLSDDEIHKLQRSGEMGKSLLRVGLAKGFILPEQLLPPDDPTLPQEE